MIITSDQSAFIRCPIHSPQAKGRVRAAFARPEPNEGAPAGYVCFHCWQDHGGVSRMPKEQVYREVGIPR